MNSYKITYVAGESETEQTYITARTEVAARKFFKKVSAGREIVDVELIDTDASATKDQEQETLEKIKVMVAELGPNSYVAAAFEGVFEDAEQNIEFDAAFSMRARWQDAENRVTEAVKEATASKAELARAEHKIQDLESNITFLQDKVIDSDDLTDIAQLIEGYISRLQDKVEAAEAAILDNAEHPETTTFCDAVRERKNLTKDIEYYQAIARRIAHAQGE